MAYCYNCGVEIPGGDKMKLCEKCKRILLPFIKFMDASTSSAVRRLVSNERNLRNAGVTDNGMEYLLRLCELHDQKRMREREEREAARAMQGQAPTPVQAEIPTPPPVIEDKYADIEIPEDEPLEYCPKAYGKFLTLAQVMLCLVGIGLIAWAGVGFFVFETYEVGSLIGAVGAFFGMYVAGIMKKLHHDLHEIKKRLK